MSTADPTLHAHARHVQAVDWFLQIRRRPLSPRARHQFERWFADPANKRVFELVAAMWIATDARALKSGESSLGEDSDASTAPLTAKIRRRRRSTSALVAALAILTAFLPINASRELDPVSMPLVTRAHENQVAHLYDGSVIRVDPDAQLTLDFGPAQRLVKLAHGRATFEVARDAHRPFRVVTPTFQVEAIGTRFIVARDHQQSFVKVLEGIVEVTLRDRTPVMRKMGAEEELMLFDEQANDGLASASVSADGWLRLSDVTLEDLVAELNRRQSTRITIDSPEISGHTLRYVRIKPDSLASILTALETFEGVSVVRGATNELIIKSESTDDNEAAWLDTVPK